MAGILHHRAMLIFRIWLCLLMALLVIIYALPLVDKYARAPMAKYVTLIILLVCLFSVLLTLLRPKFFWSIPVTLFSFLLIRVFGFTPGGTVWSPPITPNEIILVSYEQPLLVYGGLLTVWLGAKANKLPPRSKDFWRNAFSVFLIVFGLEALVETFLIWTSVGPNWPQYSEIPGIRAQLAAPTLTLITIVLTFFDRTLYWTILLVQSALIGMTVFTLSASHFASSNVFYLAFSILWHVKRTAIIMCIATFYLARKSLRNTKQATLEVPNVF